MVNIAPKLLDHAKQSVSDTFKTASKTAVQKKKKKERKKKKKKAGTTGDLIRNEIVNKIIQKQLQMRII